MKNYYLVLNVAIQRTKHFPILFKFFFFNHVQKILIILLYFNDKKGS